MIPALIILSRYLAALTLSIAGPLFQATFGPITLWLTVLLTRLFFPVTVRDHFLTIGEHTLEFIPECTAILAYMLLAFLILLTRNISFTTGVRLFCIGSILILAANLIRIELLIIVLLRFGIDAFQTLHLFIWKIVSSVYVVGVWMLLTWKLHITEIPLYSDIQYLQNIVTSPARPRSSSINSTQKNTSRITQTRKGNT